MVNLFLGESYSDQQLVYPANACVDGEKTVSHFLASPGLCVQGCVSHVFFFSLTTALLKEQL